VCLFDRMGLGKSLVAIALLAKMAKPNSRFIFVAPATVRKVIVDELYKHLSMTGVTVVNMESTAKDEPLVRSLLTSSDGPPTVGIIVTSYELMSAHAELLLSHLPKRSMVIFDEVHRINHSNTHVNQNVRRHLKKRTKCLMMSGTPISNVKDMNSLSAIVYRNVPSLQNEEAFSGNCVHPDFAKRMLCRTLEEVDLGAIGMIPQMVHEVRYIPPDEAEKSLYEEELPRAKLAGQRAHSSNEPIGYYSALERLSCAALHSQIHDARNGTVAYMNTSVSAKQRVILELAQESIAKGEKIVICAYHVTFLHILVPYFYGHGIESVAMVHGSQTPSLKHQNVTAFQTMGPDSPQVMFLSMGAGGQGMSLVSAVTIVMADSPRNPAIYDQAIDRIHRIGQTKVTRCIHLLTNGTLDEIYYHYVYPSKRHEVKRILGKVEPVRPGECVPTERESVISHLQSCWDWTQQCTTSQHVPYSPERGGPPFITIRAPREINDEALLQMQRTNVPGGLNQWLETSCNTHSLKPTHKTQTTNRREKQQTVHAKQKTHSSGPQKAAPVTTKPEPVAQFKSALPRIPKKKRKREGEASSQASPLSLHATAEVNPKKARKARMKHSQHTSVQRPRQPPSRKANSVPATIAS